MIPLTMAGEGVELSIEMIRGRDDTRRHLEELGLVVGEHVSVITSLAGNLILQVKDSRIALDRGLCARIMVSI